MQEFLALYLKLFFLLTPFFVLSTFISLTADSDATVRHRLAWKIGAGATMVTLAIFFVGEYIMSVFGITVDAFRAGSGVLLLLSAISLVFGKAEKHGTLTPQSLYDMAVVPLAVPITAGPATLGTLMVMGTTTSGLLPKLVTGSAITAACASIALMLHLSDKILAIIGQSNITILSKLTGLILSAMSLQMIVTGVRNLWLQ